MQRRRRIVLCVLRRRVLFKSHIMLNIQPIYVDHDAYISNRLGVMLRVTRRETRLTMASRTEPRYTPP